MYRLWVYVFCSVAVHAALNVLTSLVHKKEGFLPLYGTIHTGTEDNNTFNPVSFLKHKVWKPITKRARKVTSVVIPTPMPPVCYDVVGCFPMGSPWKTLLRPIGVPWRPEKIKASVYFFCRENEPSESLDLYPEANLEGISFMPNRTTVFIVHGFASTGKASWVKELANVYLKVKDVNLFCLNWEDGARSTNYLQVAANTRVVGKKLALLIKKLIEEYEARAEDFHLIGHSLGAHICSYAAKETPGIGHLTALDPAQPGFEGFSKEVRLDKSDAQFVEVLHTDARPFIPTLGFGMITNHGDVDFYFNGFFQGGCLVPQTEIHISSLSSLRKIPVEVLSKWVSCAHTRAYEYYTEAIDTSKCTFWGRKVNAWTRSEIFENITTRGIFNLPNVFSCKPDNCIPLGLTVKDSPLRGSFLVLTRYRPPYCMGRNEQHKLVDLVRQANQGFLKKLTKVKLLKN